ncbi:MAG: DUF1353 domain-containing protein [Marinobacterium sp.]|nr:DUF1353 domain-containing protein [Marinobacterium sp.]
MSDVRMLVIPPKKWWKPTRYQLLDDVGVFEHTVPAGYTTDGASVPRWLAAVAGLLAIICHYADLSAGVLLFSAVGAAVAYFPPTGHYLKAAIVHDWLLEGAPGGGVVRAGFVGTNINQGSFRSPLRNRHAVDREFHYLMKRLQVGFVRRRIMYGAVWLYSFKTLYQTLYQKWRQ